MSTLQFDSRQAPLPHLPPILKTALRCLGSVATISALSTGFLLCFLIYRAIFWKRYYTTPVIYNPNIILIFNLLLGDLLQAVAFSISFHWLELDGIFPRTPACTAQAVLINAGDVASGSFVFLIAIYTSTSVLLGRSMPLKWLGISIGSCWSASLILSTMKLGIYGHKVFGNAGFWCWDTQAYEGSRLWSHYLWIFIFEFGSLVIYVATFVIVRKRITAYRFPGNVTLSSTTRAKKSQNGRDTRINRATLYMIMYPAAYFICTGPALIARIYTMHTGKTYPIWFIILAAFLLASCGWIDSILYALTRRIFVDIQNQRSTNVSNSYNRSIGSGGRPLDRHDTDEELFVPHSDKGSGSIPVPMSVYKKTTIQHASASLEPGDYNSLSRVDSSGNMEGGCRVVTRAEGACQTHK